MNYRYVLNVLGKLIIGYGLLMTISLLLALYDIDESIKALFISVALILGTGLIMVSIKVKDKTLGIKEGYSIVLSAWFLTALFGALPLYLSDVNSSIIDAWFESVSGLTTTGATVITNLSEVPRSMLLWRSMMHWIGGMGIIVMFIAVLPHLGNGAINLFRAEVPGPTKDRLVPRIKDSAKKLWIMYTLFTLIEVILLLLAGMDLFDAINHSFSTMAAGGFSTRDESIAYYNSILIEIVIIIFIIIAGGNFRLYMSAWKNGPQVLWQNTEYKTYLLVILFATISIIANLYFVTEFAYTDQPIQDTIFQVVSLMTGTGFVTADYDQWPAFSKGILLVLMFMGGCVGSTTGGIKMLRIIILVKQALAEIKRSMHPRLVVSIKIDNRSLDNVILNGVSQFFFIYMLSFIVFVILVSATGLELMDSISAVAATIGNVGPGFGIVGPTTTFAVLPDMAKFLLSLCMLLGRLEFFTLLIIFQPGFWRGQRSW